MPLPTFNPSYYTDINSSKKWGNLNIQYTFNTAFYTDNLFDVKNRSKDGITGIPSTTNTAAAISAMNEWARVLGVKFQLAANYADAQLSLLNVASVTDGVDANNKPLKYTGVNINNNPPSTYTFNSIFIEPASADARVRTCFRARSSPAWLWKHSGI
jgi:hypothetical protein